MEGDAGKGRRCGRRGHYACYVRHGLLVVAQVLGLTGVGLDGVGVVRPRLMPLRPQSSDDPLQLRNVCLERLDLSHSLKPPGGVRPHRQTLELLLCDGAWDSAVCKGDNLIEARQTGGVGGDGWRSGGSSSVCVGGIGRHRGMGCVIGSQAESWNQLSKKRDLVGVLFALGFCMTVRVGWEWWAGRPW